MAETSRCHEVNGARQALLLRAKSYALRHALRPEDLQRHDSLPSSPIRNVQHGDRRPARVVSRQDAPNHISHYADHDVSAYSTREVT